MAVLAAQQKLRVEAVLHQVGWAPFGGDHGVMPQVPPEVVSQQLRAVLLLPWTLQLESIGVHQEDAAGTIAGGGAERAAIDGVRAAVNGVRRGITGLLDKLFRLDYLHDLRLPGIFLGVKDMKSRRTDARDDEVATFHVRMRSLRAKASAARVPAKVMQLIVAAREIYLPDEPAIAGRTRIEIDDAHSVFLAIVSHVKQRNIGQAFRWGLHGHARRGIESRVRTHQSQIGRA